MTTETIAELLKESAKTGGRLLCFPCSQKLLLPLSARLGGSIDDSPCMRCGSETDLGWYPQPAIKHVIFSLLPSLLARLEKLERAISLAECQYLGCGGNLSPDEIITSMRKVLNQALNEPQKEPPPGETKCTTPHAK